MAFSDESIIEQRRHEKHLEELNISGGRVPVGNQIFNFSRRDFYGGKLSMILPEEFAILSPENARMKYPSESRAEIILSSPEEDTDLTLSAMDVFANESNLDEYVGSFRAILKRLHPTAVLSRMQKVNTKSGKRTGYFTYELTTLERIIFGYTFMFDMENKLLYGGFSCPVELESEWEILFPQVLKSVKIKA
jgi:hypothetical protein